jgi:hypothetical protein
VVDGAGWSLALVIHTPLHDRHMGLRAAGIRTAAGPIGAGTNVSWRGLLAAVRELKAMGYSCHRVRATDGTHDENASAVLVERVDGGV